MLGTILSFVSLPPNSTGRAPSSSRLRPTDPLVTSELMRGPLLRGTIGPWQIQVYTSLSRLRRVRRLCEASSLLDRPRQRVQEGGVAQGLRVVGHVALQNERSSSGEHVPLLSRLEPHLALQHLDGG